MTRAPGRPRRSSTRGRGLTDQQERFCQEYVVDLNGTAAYKRAGYRPKDDKVAAQAASRLLGNVKVAARVKELQDARAEETGVEAKRVVTELAVVGFSNIDAFEVDNVGRVHVRDGYPPELIRAVASVDRTTIPTENGEIVKVKIRLWNKTSGLELLGRHLGMFTDKVKIEGDYGVLMVPTRTTPEDWARFAKEQQAALGKAAGGAE